MEDFRPQYYSIDGEPIDQATWMYLNFDIDERYKRVALTEVGPWRVSTVWLGLDHNFFSEGPPLIFETMAFPDDSLHEELCERYPTLEAALAGHDQIVAQLREREKTPPAP